MDTLPNKPPPALTPFPLLLPEGRARRALKIAVGHGILLLRPRLAARFESGQAPGTLPERAALAALISRYRQAGTLDRLSGLHRNFWAGDDASSFYSNTLSRFEQAFLGDHHPIVDRLAEIAGSGEFHTLCEIGCGAGQVLHHLHGHLPGIKRFIGVDLNAGQIERNRVEYAGVQGMEFVAGNATDWLAQHQRAGWILLCYGGVLEYFPQAELRRFLQTAASHPPACVAFVEPVADLQDLSGEGDSEPYGMELSFSHPYLRLLREAGLTTVWHEEGRLCGYRALLQVSRT